MSPRPTRVGVGLWTMRSTANRPAHHAALYRDAIKAAVAAEQCGFDSLWLAEHRFWYDGWCPQPIHPAAAMLAATSRLRIGTAMYLLPQHEPSAAVITARTVSELSDHRLELGVSIGYRAEEYSGMGLDIRQRVSLMETALDAFARDAPNIPLWMGGMAPAAIRRAARRGTGLMLPPTLSIHKVKALIDLAGQEASACGRARPSIGMLKDIWVAETDDMARMYYLPRLRRHYEEYATAWWARDEGEPDPVKVEDQIRRSVETAFIGSPERIADQLNELVDAGVELLVLQFHCEYTKEHSMNQMRLLSEVLLPRITGATAVGR